MPKKKKNDLDIREKKKEPAPFSDNDRYRYRSIARNFGYPKEVLNQFESAENEIQCERILKTARDKYLG